jgi:formate dehydrogenase subunit gamma
VTTPIAERRVITPRRVQRFTRTERWLHLVHASSFLVMLATGLILYLPFLAQAFGNRPVIKAVHLAVAALWLTALILVPILGDRAALRRTKRQFESLNAADLKWLRHRAARTRPQPKFNGGMKFHAIVQAALTILFFVSGALLWLGERNTSWRLPGTIAVHDVSMFVGLVFVLGHVYIAFSPEARPSLSGIVDGTVPASYAAEHHTLWNPAAEPAPQRVPLTQRRAATAAAVGVVGVVVAAVLAGLG